MNTITDLKVGDKVWVIDTANGRGAPPRGTTVSKIGSKLISVGSHDDKYRKDSMRINDQYGHWLLILDLEAYEEKKEIVKILRKIQIGSPAKDVTLEDARAAAKLLGIEV